MSSENSEEKKGYDIDTDPMLSEEQKKRLREASKIVVRVEQDPEVQEKDKLWNEAVSDIQKAYESLGKSFDSSSIKTKDDIQKAFREISDLKERKEARYGTPITGKEMGDYQESTGDRPIDQLKEATKDIPLDLVEYNSESELRNLLLAISQDSNDSRCAEATKLYSKLLNRAMSDNVNLELTSTGSDYARNKGKFRNVKRGED